MTLLEILAQVAQLELAAALVRLLTVREYAVECVQILVFSQVRRALIVHNEVVVELAIAVLVVQDALCLFTVTAPATTLLHVALKALWHGVVNDKAHVSFVNTHAERNGRDDHLNLILHPPTLNVVALPNW